MLRLMFRSGDHWSPLNVPPLSRLRRQLPSMGALCGEVSQSGGKKSIKNIGVVGVTIGRP